MRERCKSGRRARARDHDTVGKRRQITKLHTLAQTTRKPSSESSCFCTRYRLCPQHQGYRKLDTERCRRNRKCYKLTGSLRMILVLESSEACGKAEATMDRYQLSSLFYFPSKRLQDAKQEGRTGVAVATCPKGVIDERVTWVLSRRL